MHVVVVVVVDVVVLITDMHWSIISTFEDNKEIGSRTPGIIFHYIQNVKTAVRSVYSWDLDSNKTQSGRCWLARCLRLIVLAKGRVEENKN